MVANPLILLVDDFLDAREMYQEYLLFRGYRVVIAASGAEALQLALAGDRPALILMDLRMDGMTGTETLRAIRGKPQLDGIPVIAFTAHALDRERREAMLDGFDAVVTKPCLPDELVVVIESHLPNQRE